MLLRASELRCKDVISLKTGGRIGYIADFQIDSNTSCIVNLIIAGGLRCFGLLGRKKDVVIKWSDIDLIGEDTILVSCDVPLKKKRKRQR